MAKKFWTNDDMAEGVNEIMRVFDGYFPARTYGYSLQAFDPEKYDLVPKKEYQERLLTAKEKEIESLDSEYKEKRKRLIEERDALKGKTKTRED